MSKGGERFGRGQRALFVFAALVIALAGIKLAAPLLKPILVALFLAMAVAPIVGWFERFRVPRLWAVVLSIITTVGVLTGLGMIVVRSLRGFGEALPRYQVLASGFLHDARERFGKADDLPLDPTKLGEKALETLALALTDLIAGVASFLSDTLLVTLVLVFILLEATRMKTKLRLVLGRDESLVRLSRAAGNLHRYLRVKVAVSAMTGVFVGLWCWAFDLDLPMAWGLLAFGLNFIPTLGSILAAIPALLVALLTQGVGGFFAIGTGFAIVNVVFGNILEPRLMGRALGLSPLVVFLSVILWGWLLGPVGALLSGLLTMALKLALRETEDGRAFAMMLAPAEQVQDELSAQTADPDPPLPDEPRVTRTSSPPRSSRMSSPPRSGRLSSPPRSRPQPK